LKPPAASLGVWCALFSALAFSSKAVVIKIAYRLGVDAETLLAMRMLYALPFFMLMAAWSHWRQPMALTARDLGSLTVLGFFGYYLSSYADFLGLRYISAALERVVLYTYPMMVVLFVAVAARRRPSPRLLAALALSYAGIALVVLHDWNQGGANLPLGVGLVLISAVSFAIYLQRSAPVLQRLGVTRVTAYATGIACLLVLAQYAIMKPVDAIARQPWPVQWCGIGLAIGCTVIPIWLNGLAVKRLGASRVAVIATTGPVFTLLLAWLVLGEPLTMTMLAGAALVVGGVSLVSHRSAPARPAAAMQPRSGANDTPTRRS
jgi:drug/metabolite transporter (DMT)-like permease